MLPNHWKAKMHWNLSNKYDIFQKHERNLQPAQNPCKAELRLLRENFLFLVNKDFLHIHLRPEHFLMLKIGRDCNLYE